MCTAISLLIILILHKPRHKMSYTTSTILLATLFLGSWRYHLLLNTPPNDVSHYINRLQAIEGTVITDPESNGLRTSFVVRVERARTPDGWKSSTGKVMMVTYRNQRSQESRQAVQVGRIEYGDRVKISVQFYKPSPPTNPGNFSWKTYLAKKGIYVYGSAWRDNQIVILQQRTGNIVLHTAYRVRHAIVSAIYKVYPWPECSVITGMILGTYAYLPQEVLRDFCRTGTMHILAASGYNCWMLAFLLTPLLSLMRVMPRWRGPVVICCIIFYVLIVGNKPSLVRAAAMITLALLATTIKRIPNPKNLFFVAGLVILAMDPASLFDVGFQLSFLAVWGIIHVSPIIGATSILTATGIIGQNRQAEQGIAPQLARKVIGALEVTTIATVSATLLTAPLVAYYFNYVSLVSLPANLAVGLSVPAVFVAGFLAPFGASVDLIRDILAPAGAGATRIILGVVNYLGSAQYSAVSIPSPSPIGIMGYYVVLHALLHYLKTGRSATKSAAIDTNI
ncbi:MAG: ComEC/Rec2 family competence protein [Armatimonadota bacterium]